MPPKKTDLNQSIRVQRDGAAQVVEEEPSPVSVVDLKSKDLRLAVLVGDA